MNPSKLRAVACAAFVFGAPATLMAAQSDAAPAPQALMLIAADDTRGEGVTRSAETTARDAAITAKVKTRLLADDDVKGMKIDVDTYNGVVMLSGKAGSDALIAKAAKLAMKVDGVKSVTNKLSVGYEDDHANLDADTRTAETTARDATISTKVKAKLLADPDIAGMKIDVDTRNGVVTLKGTAATDAQMSKAAAIASKIEHVTRVENRLTLPGASLDANIEIGAPVIATETSRSVGTTVKDAAISSTVKTKLLADPDVSGTKIDVDVRNKVVMLSGTVASEAQMREAELIASQVDGVVSVSNRLSVAK